MGVRVSSSGPVFTMSCRKIRDKTRVEQDFYLQWASRVPTDEERLEFLRYDSHGGVKPAANPILEGKTNYHLLATEWLNAYFLKPGYEGVWPGGMWLVIEERGNPRFLAMLLREFGDEAVLRWFTAAWNHLFSWTRDPATKRLTD